MDAVACPTVPMTPPAIADLAATEDFNRINGLLLRNPAASNFLDRCAISLPCHGPGEAPVGLMLMGEHGGDHRLLAVAQAVQAAL